MEEIGIAKQEKNYLQGSYKNSINIYGDSGTIKLGFPVDEKFQKILLDKIYMDSKKAKIDQNPCILMFNCL